MVKGCRAEHDLVISVTINITHSYAMSSLSVDSLARCLALVEPFVNDMLAIELYSPSVCLRVVATEENSTWYVLRTVKVCHTGKETVTAVSLKWRTVAPASTVIFRFATESECAVRVVVNGVDSVSVNTREYGQELRAMQDTSVCHGV